MQKEEILLYVSAGYEIPLPSLSTFILQKEIKTGQ
jgi:hypothetical protein